MNSTLDPAHISPDPFTALVALLHENDRHEDAVEMVERRFVEMVMVDEEADIDVGSDYVNVQYRNYHGRHAIERHDNRGQVEPRVAAEGYYIHEPTDTEFETRDEYLAEIATEDVLEQFHSESYKDAGQAFWARTRGV